jgi:signal transduction histidine kinase
MDIEFVFNRSSVYAIASSVVLAIYLLSSNVLGKAFSKIHLESARTANLFSILIAALLFAPMKKRVQDFIDIYFDQRRYDYRKTLENLSETLSTMLQLDELSGVLLHQLDNALRPEFAALLLRGEVYDDIGDKEKLEEAMREFDSATIKDSPERVGERNLAVPLMREYRLVGFILLGGKRSGRSYNVEDISLMGIVSHQTAISIENAIMYEKLHEQVDLMTGAHNRLVDTFKQYHPEIPPEKPVPENEDIISELNMITEALVRSSEKLRELDDAKSQFLLSVSHELHTPLASVKLAAQNLIDGVVGELDGRQKEYMERIFWNCNALIGMVDDLLDLSRIGRKEMELNLTDIQLLPLISNVVSDLRPTAVKKGLSLTLSCPPDVTLLADEDKLRRIAINLLDNAIKFTPPGGEVSFRVEDKGECVDISVEDTGIGIPAESHDEIFDRFQKGKGNWKSAGMGLGLAIVKGFVELHGWEISVQSEAGKGSRFTITLKR